MQDEPRLTDRQVAERAGVDPSFIAQLIAAGALVPGDGPVPFTSGDVRRARLVAGCADAGMSVEAIGTAIRSGHLTLSPLDQPQYDRWGDLAEITYEELAASSGVPVDLLLAIHHTLGGPPATPSDRCRRDELDVSRRSRWRSAAGSPAKP